MAGIFREKVLGESSHGEPLPGKRHAAETRGELYFRSQAFPKWMAQNCSAVVDSPLSSLFFFFFWQKWTLSLWQGIESRRCHLAWKAGTTFSASQTIGAGRKNGLQQLHYLGRKNSELQAL